MKASEVDPEVLYLLKRAYPDVNVEECEIYQSPDWIEYAYFMPPYGRPDVIEVQTFVWLPTRQYIRRAYSALNNAIVYQAPRSLDEGEYAV